MFFVVARVLEKLHFSILCFSPILISANCMGLSLDLFFGLILLLSMSVLLRVSKLEEEVVYEGCFGCLIISTDEVGGMEN
jgi:hypothetical protein